MTAPQKIIPTINHILCHKAGLWDKLIMQFLSATSAHFIVNNCSFMAASSIATSRFLYGTKVKFLAVRPVYWLFHYE